MERWSLEDRLIHYCARTTLDENMSRQVEAILGRDLDWDYIIKGAERENVAQLLYHNLSRTFIEYSEMGNGKPRVPIDILRALKKAYHRTAIRNIIICQKLGELLDSFREAGIEVILLKGMALIETVYPNIALRPMVDIDLLVHQEELPQVQTTLNRLGYRNSLSDPHEFCREGMVVDLHWDMVNIVRVKSRRRAHQVKLSNIWRNSTSIQIDGRTARILSPEDLVIDLCLHLTFHHGLRGLIWFVDLQEVLRYYNEQLDLHKLVEYCTECKVTRPVFWCLFYIKQILGTDIPPDVIERLRPKREGFLEKRFFILNNQPINDIRFFWTFSATEGIYNKLRFLREIVLPNPGVLKMRYGISPSRPLYSYYLTHLKRVGSSCLNALRRLVSHRFM